MTSATDSRHTMLVGLTQDLFAAGWDQECKMWFVLGEPDDEYMEYVGSFQMDPEHWLMHRAEEGSVREHVRGVVVCFESWTYPKALNKALDADNRLTNAYRNLVPANEHPDGTDVRTLVMTGRDGRVLRTIQYGDSANEVSVQEMAPRPNPGVLTGDKMVDYMRAMLGIAELFADQSITAIIAKRPDLQAMMQTARTESWEPTRTSGELFLNMEPNVQRSMMPTMPDEVRTYLVDKGFDFDALANPTFEEVTDDSPGT